jgi:phosphopantetheinyl transferase (holo-ACP synthase)
MLHRVLSPGEIELVLSSDDEVRTFLELWVRKEALAKAAGLGVDEDVTAIDLRGASPVLMDGFEVTDLNIGDRFVAATAVPPGCRLQMSTLIKAAV